MNEPGKIEYMPLGQYLDVNGIMFLAPYEDWGSLPGYVREITAMAGAGSYLGKLDSSQRVRVLRYLNDRWS